MRYFQLEKGESIDKNEIIGIFDLETAGASAETKALFKRLEEQKGVVNLSNDIPRSFVLCEEEFSDRIYLSGLSTQSIEARTERLKTFECF
ncbi:MAG: DUF370 domain-containing protein [Clostridia bacterium]|nr:DUF370 domain-containing protein [Clostridia bacterium]